MAMLPVVTMPSLSYLYMKHVQEGGRRGQAAAVLLSIEEYEALHARKPSSPREAWRAIRLQAVGSPLELDAAVPEMRADIARSLERHDTRPKRRTMTR